jgi:hypothetical protein
LGLRRQEERQESEGELESAVVLVSGRALDLRFRHLSVYHR